MNLYDSYIMPIVHSRVFENALCYFFPAKMMSRVSFNKWRILAKDGTPGDYNPIADEAWEKSQADGHYMSIFKKVGRRTEQVIIYHLEAHVLPEAPLIDYGRRWYFHFPWQEKSRWHLVDCLRGLSSVLKINF